MEEQRNNSHRIGRKTIFQRLRKRKKTSRKLKFNDSVENFLFLMPYHAVFGFLNPLLVTLLQVCVQGTTLSCFETHTADMWVFVMATVIYCFAFGADIKYKLDRKSNSQVFGAVAIISGSLSSASLVSIILPLGSGRLIYLAWGALLMPIIFAYQQPIFIQKAYNWLQDKIKKTFSEEFSKCCNSFNGNTLTEQPQVPV